MSKRKTNKPADAVPFDADVKAGIATVVTITSAALDGMTGTVLEGVTKICNSIDDTFVEFHADALKQTVNDVAELRGWNDAKRGKVYKAELSALLKAYAGLPSAMTKYKAATGLLNYHHAVGLARLLNKGESATKAVAAMITKQPGRGQAPAAKFADLCKRICKMKQPPTGKGREKWDKVVAAIHDAGFDFS